MSLLALLITAAPAHARTVWLCHPAQARNPCTIPMGTTVLSRTGKVLKVRVAHPARHPKADCFYLYPTVSEQSTPVANLHIDPAERSIARQQAARYSEVCRVFAPMYRQQTLSGLSSGNATQKQVGIAYRSVRRAWRTYLRENPGRRFVLIGHSQGSEMLRRLITRQIDPSPSLRRRLLSAHLLGGNVAVAKGRGAGGDFRHIPACRRPRQRHCVVAYSAFQGAVPVDSLYGRMNGPFNPGDPAKLAVLCTNPAALGGGRARLRSLFPVKGSGFDALGVPIPAYVTTPWFELRGLYTGACSTGSAHVLQIAGAPLAPYPDATWGLHLLDVNIALGDLLALVRAEL
jgi:hypothetical protein